MLKCGCVAMANSGPADKPIGHMGQFAPKAAKVWAIPPGADFLGSLAKTLALEFGLAQNPAALADALIYVPNRRSARALALALHRHAGGHTILPPDIRALGDLEMDEPPSGAEEALTDLGPALSPAKRLGTLAMLVMRFYAKREVALPPSSAIAAARELGRLLDSAALTGDVDWAMLPSLVEDTDLAAHWKDSVEFLAIIAQAWPHWLAENGATEPFERRLQVAKAVAAAVRAQPPKGPFIIAGSTGATPASRELMLAATALPGGLVILPGLDSDAPENMWAEITAQPENGVPGEPDHPQFSLAGTLRTLGLTARDVPNWPGIETDTHAIARRRLVHESLAPASQTADWLLRLEAMAAPDTKAAFAQKALCGLTVLEAADEAEEALLAALTMREALETHGQTAALITPDSGLARQVSAILKQWNITVPPSGGVPLGRTQAGALVLLVLQWALDTGDPVALTSLLKHPLVDAAPEAIAIVETAYLRGPRRWTDLSNLIDSLPARTEEANKSRHTRLPEAAATTAAALLAPLQKLAETAAILADPDLPVTGAHAAETLIRLINSLVGDETKAWSGRDGEAASRTLEAASEVTAALSPLSVRAFADILESLAASVTVPETAMAHPRLNIWGPLEARLQTADRIILAGLNESVWPDRPPADAFLPRQFRARLGLPAPEARLGLAAHDFAQMACAPNVVMLYSARRDDAPAVASRWILRLKTLSEGALGKTGAIAALSPAPEHDARLWASALTRDLQTAPPMMAEPRPNPPVAARPKGLSVTRIDTLQRDPYSIYAGDILRLKKLDALNAPLDARPRGTAIHKALEEFDIAPEAEQTGPALHARFLAELRAAGEPEHLILANRAPYAKAASDYIDWWQIRQNDLRKAWPEIKGTITFSIEGDPFTLSGTADRIEQHTDGTCSIIDYKTGDGKSRKQIDAGLEQQLPFLALIAREGDMQDAARNAIAKAPAREFGYVSVRFSFEAKPITKGADDARELTDAAKEILIKLIAAYRAPDAIYLSVPRIAVKSKYNGDYDLLARRGEWAGARDDGGE